MKQPHLSMLCLWTVVVVAMLALVATAAPTVTRGATPRPASSIPSIYKNFYEVTETTHSLTLTRRRTPLHPPADLLAERLREYESLRSSGGLSSLFDLGGGHDFDFIPEYLGNLRINSYSQSWSGNCFRNISAQLQALSPTNFQIVVDVANARSVTCLGDLLLFGDRENLYLRWFFFEGQHHVNLNDVSFSEVQDIEARGISAFLFQDGAYGTIEDLVGFALLLFSTPWSDSDALSFLKERMGIEYAPRTLGLIDVDPDTIPSGTLMATQRWDLSEVLIQYGTGAYIGHSVMAVRRPDGLHVCESTGRNSPDYWPPPYGIICTPWSKWISLAQAANYAVTMVPMNPALQKVFDNDKANAFVDSVLGSPYGFADFLYGWIDTPEDNFPPPLTGQLLAVALELALYLLPDEVEMVFVWGLNFRLGTSCNTSACIYDTLTSRNMNLTSAMAIPNQDEWRYPTGPGYVCDSFALGILKAGGVFGGAQVQTTEFTPKDEYTLGIWDPQRGRTVISGCAAAINATEKGNEGFCQIMGAWYMQMPQYNTVQPYSHMAEHCPSKWPDYVRTQGC